ncbi:MAG: type II toxin-antitoxin system VapC family toxin [Deltaproteobacteria bacterium]|nr:type II toxin-antitoxin system VapC family toxin [Deltaproteobacteria bacterium]
MVLLLDTCTLIWLTSDQQSLSSRARACIQEHAGALHASSMSAFEIGIKHRKGTLRLALEPGAWFTAAMDLHGIREIPVDAGIAARSTALPDLHSDPIDRILIATAEEHGLTVVTPDRLIAQYGLVDVLW